MRFLVALGSLACLCSASAGPTAPEAVGVGTSNARPGLMRAIEVLHEWDTLRARAWADGDLIRLRSLYVPGSSAGAADVGLARAYAARGLVVRTITTQVFGVEVLEQGPVELRLRLWDRVAGGLVSDGSRRTPLPATRPAMRVIEFRRLAGEWKVAAVSGSGSAPHGERPRPPDPGR